MLIKDNRLILLHMGEVVFSLYPSLLELARCAFRSDEAHTLQI